MDFSVEIGELRRRLKPLKSQAALYGANTQPEITIQIQDLTDQIRALHLIELPANLYFPRGAEEEFLKNLSTSLGIPPSQLRGGNLGEKANNLFSMVEIDELLSVLKRSEFRSALIKPR